MLQPVSRTVAETVTRTRSASASPQVPKVTHPAVRGLLHAACRTALRVARIARAPLTLTVRIARNMQRLALHRHALLHPTGATTASIPSHLGCCKAHVVLGKLRMALMDTFKPQLSQKLVSVRNVLRGRFRTTLCVRG